MNELTEEGWHLQNISKWFYGVKALDHVSLNISKGEIVGLMGENGCGKSTLIKCLSGVYHADEGEILLNGHKVDIPSPSRAKSLGIATVFQEFSLVPTISVAENIFIGRFPRNRIGMIDWKSMYRQTQDMLHSLEIDLDPRVNVNELSVAEQQLVEITKAITLNANLIIMDEPTTALGMTEIKRLHSLLKRLSSEGRSILYISHRLDEMVEIVDRVVVLRNGKHVGSASREQLNIPTLVKMMVGEDIKEHYPKEHNKTDKLSLQVKGIYTENKVKDTSFDLYRGEVFGLAGLLGSGRTEIARALSGVDPIKRGQVILNNKKIKLNSPKKAIEEGIAFITENRKTDGLFFNFAAPENIGMSNIKGLMKNGMINIKYQRKVSKHYIEKLKLTPSALERSVQYLSGGNQQKVIIARWLFSNPDIFIMDEPTQGIDVGAKYEIYNIINELTKQEKSVILISSDLPELIAMSDRVGIVRNGTIFQITEAGNLDHKELIQSTIDV